MRDNFSDLKKKVTLSVIVPVKNEEKYLPLLLAQIKKQDFSDYEIIIADAESSDKSVEIAKAFDCKIVKGGLPAKGRNEGAKVAKGKILLFMDADNLYLPDGFFKKLISEFEKRKLGIASFPIYPAGNLIDKIIYFFYNNFVKLTQKFTAFATNAILIKKDLFERIGGFDEEITIGEDHDLAKRAKKISKFGFLETEPILTSARRFEVEGRLKTYGKYLVAALYMLFFGSVKRKIFEYRFDGILNSKNEKKEIKLKKMMEKLPKPDFKPEFPKLKKPFSFKKERLYIFLFLLVILILGIGIGFFLGFYCPEKVKGFLERLKIPLPEEKVERVERIIEKQPIYLPQTSQEEAIIKVVKESSPAVVSVVVTKDIPKLKLYYESPFEEFKEFFKDLPFEFKIPKWKQEGYEKKQIGGGTAFFVSKDGLLLTNAHVVSDKEADYTVFTNTGKRYPAKVLARDKIRDLAILKVEGNNFPTLKLGNSDKLQIGQTVIAIGNALGEFRNTVSVGVISGLGRKITASGGGIVETIEDVIQTDAAINPGNSGGPLLNLKGEVVGINFAMASGAENIGFAIPINSAKRDIEQVKKYGKILIPFLGVRYLLITEDLQKKNNLPVNYGAWIVKGAKGERAIFPDSPAEKAGLREGDIILEFNKEKITVNNSLAEIIIKYQPGDTVVLKVLREGKELIFKVTLAEFPQQ